MNPLDCPKKNRAEVVDVMIFLQDQSKRSMVEPKQPNKKSLYDGNHNGEAS